MNTASLRPAAFLDRDGTLIVEHGFLSDPEGVRALPGAINAVRQLNAWGYLVIGVTNQSGVARGYFDEADVLIVNQRVIDVFGEGGARIDAIYFCPHYPSPGKPLCGCRKPSRGMIDHATRDFDIDLSKSFVAGDRFCDVQLGHAIGCPGILLLTGYGREEMDAWSALELPDHTADNIRAAVRWWGETHHLPSSL